jgi:hypothetical protein
MRLCQVCDHCGGPFGMVTHRSWGGKFCKRRCKDAFLREIMLGRGTVLGMSWTLSSPEQKGSGGAPVINRHPKLLELSRHNCSPPPTR